MTEELSGPGLAGRVLPPRIPEERQYTDEHASSGVGAELPGIETWPNQFADREYEIEIEMPEFTSVCPKTGLPDSGNIVLRYVPDQLCLELKSLKMYSLAYRNLGIFQENIVNRMLDDVVRACRPVHATITGDFAPRGGISTVITASYDRAKDKKKHHSGSKTRER